MRRHPKASAVGSTLGTGHSRARLLPTACLCVLSLLAFSGIGASSATAAPMGVTNYFGNPNATGAIAGGLFSTNPRGTAVRNSNGDLYVVDTGNNRIQRFSSSGAFISAWGADVIPGGAAGTGTVTTGSNSVAAVATTSKAFLVGQPIEGTGIPAGTTITAIAATTLTLSQNANGAATGVPGTILTTPTRAGNVAVNEVQTVTLAATITAGNFKLTLTAPNPQPTGTNPQTTANIPFNASAAEVQSALEALANIGAGNVAVTSSNPGGGATPGGPYAIEFKGTRYADTNLPQLAVAAGTPALVGGSATNVSTVEGGVAFEVCTAASECKAGVAIAENAPGGSLNGPQGVAINQGSGDVYVTNQGLQRVEQFSASGTFIRAWGRNVVKSGAEQADEEQALTVDATAGQYKLGFGASTSADIAFNASAAEVEAALNSLGSISAGGGSVAVAGGPGGAGGTQPYLITFGGSLANVNQTAITSGAGTTPLSGGSASATIATLREGAEGFEVCNLASNCQKGLAGGTAGAFANSMGYPAVVPAGATNAGNLLVAELGTKKVSEFTASGNFVRAFGFDVVSVGPGNQTVPGFEVCQASAFDSCKAGAESSPAGAVGSFRESQPSRVAVDTAGNIYTVESSGTFRVQKFTPSGGGGLTPSHFNPSIGGGETLTSSSPAASTSNTPTDVAVDPSDNHLYVVRAMETGKGTPAATSAERRIFEFDGSGALVETHLANYGVNSVNGFALKADGEPGYLSSSTPKAGVYVIAEPVLPTASVAATTAITANSAVLHGTINPNGGGPLHTTYRFEYSTDGGAHWTKAGVTEPDIGSGESPVSVEAPAQGLEVNKDHEVRLVAIKGGASTSSSGHAGDFKTLTEAPLAETLDAWWEADTLRLILRARVNPNNMPTTYWFEYGPEDCASNPCASVPLGQDASAGGGGQGVVVSRAIEGLDTGSDYHYRVIATSAVGTTTGLDRSVGSGPSTAPCANEALREENNSAGLPECRAYELVSAAESNGLGAERLEAISGQGTRMVVLAQTLGDPDNLSNQANPFVAERGPGGWEIAQVGPPVKYPVRVEEPYSYPADLSAMLWSTATSGEFIRNELHQWTLSRMDGSVQIASPPLTPIEWVDLSSSSLGRGNFRPAGGSSDLSTFVFQKRLLSGETATYLVGEPLVLGSSNIYQVSGADTATPTLSLVNRDPSGALIANTCGAGVGGFDLGKSENRGRPKNAVSNDGAVVYFTASPSGSTACNPAVDRRRIYKRIDGTSTVAVTQSQCTRVSPACAATDGDDVFWGASSAGDSVYFTTTRQLTNSDEDTTADLYLYDSTPPSGQPNLIQASAGLATANHPTAGKDAKVLGVVDSADDGSRVYFVAEGELTAAANAQSQKASPGANNLYVLERDDAHPGGRLAFVGPLAASGESQLWTLEGGNERKPAFALPQDQGNGDGHFLLFATQARLLPQDTDSVADAYRYDDEAGELVCVSCQGNGAFAARIRQIGSEFIARTARSQRTGVASADVSAVVFTTEEQLLGSDQNAAADVYEWHDGVLNLISGGAGAGGAAGEPIISPDGKSIAFLSATRILPSDPNSARDVYVARVDGGFPPAAAREDCLTEEACHGPASAAPASPPIGNAPPGSANPPEPKPCKKGQVRRHGKCVKKPRQQKKQHKDKKHKKRSSHSRGGQR